MQANVPKIVQYKRNSKVSTSEELFNITPPSDYQCQNIDYIIFSSEAITDNTRDIEYNLAWEEYDKIERKLDRIDQYGKELAPLAEEIREAIEQVREWGQEWKNLALTLIEKCDIDVEEIRNHMNS